MTTFIKGDPDAPVPEDGTTVVYDEAKGAYVPGPVPDSGTSGSGILNVSGTVDLDDVPGIREVYATASATVEGVALAAGDAAVFRYLSGAWTYMVVGEHTTWQSISATPVTANVPTADDTANTITWTPKTGVQYVIGGTVRTPPYSVGDVTTSVTVTAQATAGYTLSGTSSWTFNFTGSAPTDTTPPTAGTLAVTGTGDAGSTRTLTVTGASDAGGLHAQPYRFSTNGGTTWSAYQSSNVFTTGALAAGTYQPRVMVRDAAGNTATASAANFTVAAAPSSPTYAETFGYPDGTEMNQKFTEVGNTQMYSSSALWNAGTGTPSGTGALVYGGKLQPTQARALVISPWEQAAARTTAAAEVDYAITAAEGWAKIGIGNQVGASGFWIRDNGNVYEADGTTILGAAPSTGTARAVLSGGTLTLSVNGTVVATVNGVTEAAQRTWIATNAGGNLDNWKVWNTP